MKKRSFVACRLPLAHATLLPSGWETARGGTYRAIQGGRTYYRSRFLGRGCDETLLVKKRVFSEKGGGIQGMRGLVRISTRRQFSEEVRAIQ